MRDAPHAVYKTEYMGSYFEEFSPVSRDGLSKIIMGMKNKSCELDIVPMWLLKLCLKDFLPVLTELVNTSFHSAVFPGSLSMLM